ncbi:MAG: hypothetical protein ACEQSR_00370 [Candidatus Methylacidiphilales bacterium]
MSTQKHLTELHAEHKEWLNKLSFYKDDLTVMQSRLDEVASKNSSKDALVMIEHFQNQFKIQNEQIDILKHDINQHSANIESSISNNPVASDHRTMEDHAPERERMERFEELFASLRKDLFGFLAKWM